MARAHRSAGHPSFTGPSERAAIDRLRQLSIILPAMGQEVAAARREAARLRVENAQLLSRVAGLERRRVGEAAVLQQAQTRPR